MVRVDGGDLFVREAGSGVPVLLIHGGGVNADHWGECFGRIAEFARAVAYDQRGFSRSVHPPVRGIKRHGDDAAALLEALHAAPAVVLGHSFGASIGLDLAARRPELTRALVLIEPPTALAGLQDRSMLAMAIKLQAIRALRGGRSAAEYFHRWAATYATGGNSFDREPEPIRAAALDNAPALAEMFRYSPESLGKHLPKGLSRIECPVTLIEGTLSQPGLRRPLHRLARKLPHADVITVPGAGHVVQFDAPDVVVEATRRAVVD